MQFGPLWLGTVIGSKALEISDILFMYKVAADDGYKMDGNKVGPVTVLDESIGTEVESFITFVPIINLVVQMQRSMATRMQIEEILRTFNEYGAMEEMTKEEKERYQEKPTGRNAYKISEEAYTRYLLPLYATINDSVGVLDLNIGKDLDDVVVTNVIGAFEIISDEDIKKFVDLLINNFETKEEFIEAIEESNKIIVGELKKALKAAKKIRKIANKEGKKMEKQVVREIDQTYKDLEEKKKSSKDETQLVVIDKEKQALVVYKEELKALTKQEKKENPLEYLNQLDEKKTHLEKIKEELLSDESLKKENQSKTNKELKK